MQVRRNSLQLWLKSGRGWGWGPASRSPPHPPSLSPADMAETSGCPPPGSPEVSSKVFSVFSGSLSQPLEVNMQDRTGMPSWLQAAFHHHFASASEMHWAGDTEVMLPAPCLSGVLLFCPRAEPSPLMAYMRMRWLDLVLWEPGAPLKDAA